MHEKRNNMTAFTSMRRTALGALTIIAGALLVMPAQAQNYPISSGQRAACSPRRHPEFREATMPGSSSTPWLP